MSDNWIFDNKKEPVTPPEESPAEAPPVAEPVDPAEAAPVTEPVNGAETSPATEPVVPQTPPAAQPPYQQPPLNGWSSDGSYRFVPPRAAQPPVTPPPYQSPTPPYNGYSSTGSGYPPYRPATPVQQPTAYPYGTAVPPVPPSGNQQPPRKHKGWVVALALIVATVLIACLVMGIYAGVSQMGGQSGDNSDPSSGSSANEESSRPDEQQNAPSLGISSWDNDDGGLATKEIVKRNYASTVLLTSYTRTDDYYYFGQSDVVEAGASTGIVMTEDGYIITNRHCVINESTGEPYDQIDVTLYGGTVYEDAQVIGADEATDLAVIRIEATGLTAAQFGDSSELEVGDRVVALGNAAGLEWSASEGIVSALARDVYEDTGYAIRCLQVDASINPGNSGGPLLNNQGLVVGINSAKISATDYEGIGFTIPINEAKEIIDSLIKYGYVKGRVALGITGQTVSTGQYNGFMITEIQSASNLKGTNVQVGDLIVAVDGVTIVDYGTLRAELAKHQVGDTVELKLLHSERRTGKVTSYTVRVELKEQTN